MYLYIKNVHKVGVIYNADEKKKYFILASTYSHFYMVALF